MPTSDDQLKKKQEGVEKLRAELDAKNSEILRLRREHENDATSNALDSEAEALKAEIKAKDEEIKALGGAPSKVEVPTPPTKRAAANADETEKKEG
ncbi:hypothetical protein AB0F25_30515 [Streptomyces wedmorensis]|uniref:hypothetical protein n=1 Tax=Streptomyces wedmorensis TaxID=43759 RepID=UPI003421840B